MLWWLLMVVKDIVVIVVVGGQVGFDCSELFCFVEDVVKMGVVFDQIVIEVGEMMVKWCIFFWMMQDEVVVFFDKINYFGNIGLVKVKQILVIVMCIGFLVEVVGLVLGQIVVMGVILVGVGIQEDVVVMGMKNFFLILMVGVLVMK